MAKLKDGPVKGKRQTFGFRLSLCDLKTIKAAADDLDIPVSKFVRNAAIGYAETVRSVITKTRERSP